MEIRSIAIGLFLGLLVSACASVPQATKEEEEKAKTFQVESGKSNIYLYQLKSDDDTSAKIFLNGIEAGRLGPQSFFLWSVNPGAHELTSVIEETARITIRAEAGNNYFVLQDIQIGSTFGGRVKKSSELKKVSIEEGKKRVKESRMVVSKN